MRKGNLCSTDHAITGTRFHHLGYVVPAIDVCIEGFAASFGAVCRTETIEDPIQRVKVVFLLGTTPGQPQIELVEPVGEKSPVMRFLQRGGGLHHVCYEVADLTAQLEYMQSIGATVLRRPRPGLAFENRLIAWVMTRNKILIEYLESTKSNEADRRSKYHESAQR